MAQLEVNISLTKLTGAFRYTIRGKTSSKECVCIPIETLSEDKNQNVWLKLRAYDNTRYPGQTHTLKQSYSKQAFEALKSRSNGEDVQTPFCGSIRAVEGRKAANSAMPEDLPEDDIHKDLPF